MEDYRMYMMSGAALIAVCLWVSGYLFATLHKTKFKAFLYAVAVLAVPVFLIPALNILT